MELNASGIAATASATANRNASPILSSPEDTDTKQDRTEYQDQDRKFLPELIQIDLKRRSSSLMSS